MDNLVMALGPAFAAGMAVQQLLEFLNPVFDQFKWKKKYTMGLISLVVGLVLSFGAGLRVLEPLGVPNPSIFDPLVTGLLISAGTEGLNSVMKFLGYAKEQKKECAHAAAK